MVVCTVLRRMQRLNKGAIGCERFDKKTHLSRICDLLSFGRLSYRGNAAQKADIAFGDQVAQV